jgi:hypothetical protein
MVRRKNQKGKEMKNVIAIVVLVALLVAGCSDQYTASVHGGGGIGVRIGNIIDANRVEVGGGAFWLDGEKDPQSLELYAIRYGPNIIEVTNPFAAGPEKLNGRPYFGVSLERDCDLRSTSFSPITGIALEQFLYAEYNINKEDAILGIKYTWEF